MKSHRRRGALVAGLSGLGLAVLMFLPLSFHGGIAIELALLVLCIAGILDAQGLLRATPRQAPRPRPVVELDTAPTWLRALAGFHIPWLYTALGFVVAGGCRLSVLGTPGASAWWSGPLLIGVGLALTVVARLRRRPFDGDLHEGALVLALATATIMATLGSQGLWDCWETHYGEVARRQLEQHDWISLFWEDEWFFSKPILLFWMMDLGLLLFGCHVGPDQVSQHVEWGLRFFVGALGIAVLYGVYALLARRISRRAGLFAALVLGTMPLFGFMTRQAITDLPFVGFMTLAVVLFLLGLTAARDATVDGTGLRLPIGRGRALELTGLHAVLAGYLVVMLPQLLYMGTRSARFVFGTAGRGDLKLVHSNLYLTGVDLSDFALSLFGAKLGGAFDLSLDWVLLALAYTVPFALFLRSLGRERRVDRLYFHGMYICLTLSVMAKGLPGLALPILGLFGYWILVAPWSSLRRPKELWRWNLTELARLDAGRGVLALLLLATPWYMAMTVRHGIDFLNRFFYHDHFKRLAMGVHGDTGTFQYFVEQFAYAAFPWVVLLPAALLSWPFLQPRPDDPMAEPPAERSRRMIERFAMTWTLLTFALLALMVTKFHHYVLPLLPPAALLIALLLEDLWTARLPRAGAVVVAGLAVLFGVTKALAFMPEGTKGVLGGYAQLIGLFIYKYERPYPSGAAYDFTVPLLVFALLFGVAFAGLALVRRRKLALVLCALVALAFGHWTVQHYMVRLAPHWTQKHLIDEYYAKRRSPDERLVAYQMNWKGENFYTGNRIVVYVSAKSGSFDKWLEQHRGQRQFFLTEPSRFAPLVRRIASKGGMKPLADTSNKYKLGVADAL